DHQGLEGPGGVLMAAKTTRVVMPQLGESVHEGTISKWLVKPGDKVVEFEPMLEVDTDKVNAEVPAPVSGSLREILAKEGETGQAGAEIAVVETGVQHYAAKVAAAPAAAPAPAAPAKPGEGDQVVQLTRVRRLIAENMTRSKQTIPHAWQTQEVDMSGVVANRNANKGLFQKQE